MFKKQAEGRVQALDYRRQHPRPRLRGEPAEPEVAGRLYLHLDGGRLALCRRRAGPVLPARCRLVREGGPGCLTGHGRAHDGRLAPRQGRRAAPSFRYHRRQPALPAAVELAEPAVAIAIIRMRGTILLPQQRERDILAEICAEVGDA